MRPSPGTKTFGQINFGFADADFEFERAPRLLRDGYFDLNGNESKILHSHENLVLGYKGSGKSAIGARLRLLALDSPAQYLVPRPTNISEMPLDNFRGIAPEKFDALQRYEWAWRLLLLAKIIENGAGDTGAHVRSQAAMHEAKRLLASAGVEPQSPSSLKKLRTTKVESTITLPKFYERTSTREPNGPEDHIRTWLAYMEAIVETFRSQRRHFYFLDGLDDLRVVGGGRGLLLGGLLNAVQSVNELCRQSEVPVKVVLACRTDVFGKIDAPRAGKFRRDFAVEMDWYQNPRDSSTAHLFQMINMRAKLVAPEVRDVVGTYFPRQLLHLDSHRSSIEQTRHTPRDLLQLMKIVGKQVDAPGKLGPDLVLAGFADYSDTYFTDEVQDAMRFYFDGPVRERALELLGTIRKRHFPMRELSTQAKGSARFKKIDVDELVSVLFENGFIGNLTPGGPTRFSPDYYRFKYRSQRASLRHDEDLVVHPGLWKALNVA